MLYLQTVDVRDIMQTKSADRLVTVFREDKDLLYYMEWDGIGVIEDDSRADDIPRIQKRQMKATGIPRDRRDGQCKAAQLGEAEGSQGPPGHNEGNPLQPRHHQHTSDCSCRSRGRLRKLQRCAGRTWIR